MQQDQIEVIGSYFLEKSRDDDIGIGSFLIGDTARIPPDFGDDRVMIAGNTLEGGKEIRVGAVQIGQIEQPDAALVAAPNENLKFVLAHAGLVGFPVASPHAGAEA